MPQPFTSIPTEAKLLDDIRALRVEIDAANKRIRLSNVTIISQANELTTLRNIICRTCKRKFLDATLASSPSPAPYNGPLHGLADLSSSPTPQVAGCSTSVEPTSLFLQSTTTVPVAFQSTTEVPNSQVSRQISTRVSPPQPHAGTSTSFNLDKNPHLPSTANLPASLHAHARSPAAGKSSNQPRYPIGSLPDSARPVPVVHQAVLRTIAPVPVPFLSTRKVPAPQSSSRLIPTSLPQPPQAGTSSSIKRAAARNRALPPGGFGNTATTFARPGNPEHDSEHPLGVTIKHAFAHNNEHVYCVKFSLDGKYIAVGLSGGDLGNKLLDGKVIVYSTDTGEQACLLVEHTEKERSGVRTVCFSPNGNQLVIGHSDGHIMLWEIASQRVRNMFRRHHTGVTSLDFSPNGQSVVSASGDTTVRICSVRDGSSKVLNDEHIMNWHWYRCVKFSSNGRHVAAANNDGFLRIWDFHTCQLVVKWHGHQNVVSSLACMPDGKGLVGGSLQGTVKYWHISSLGDNWSTSRLKDTVTLFRRFDEHTGGVSSLAITADGQWLLSGSLDRTARIWNISTGMQRCTLLGHPGWIWSVDISRVGDYLAIGDSKGHVSLWRYRW